MTNGQASEKITPIDNTKYAERQRRSYENRICFQVRMLANGSGVDYLLKNHFPTQISDSKRLMQENLSMNSHKNGIFQEIKITSENVDIGEYIFNQKIKPELEDKSYDEETIYNLHISYWEAFLNAVKHGNQAGGKKYYSEKNMAIPTEREANRKKIIKMASLITSQYAITTMRDQGPGLSPQISAKIANPNYQPTMEELLANSGRGFMIIKGTVDEIHHGIDHLGSYFSMIKYNPAAQKKE